ncbi:MAG: hypothetical protein M3063_05320 [Actinomycetota bacterium]|nr:hypothetical protein [Actinomycetota bacterium]
MAADSPDALQQIVAERCTLSDADGQALFIEVEDGDEMTERWASLGFATTTTVEMPWGLVHLLVRSATSERPNRLSRPDARVAVTRGKVEP